MNIFIKIKFKDFSEQNLWFNDVKRIQYNPSSQELRISRNYDNRDDILSQTFDYIDVLNYEIVHYEKSKENE